MIAVVSTPEKGDLARAAGAHEVVSVDGFRDRVRRLTDGRGVNMIVDPVGGDRFTDSLRSLGREGRLLVLGFTGGQIPTVKVNRLLLSNITVMGVASKELWVDDPSTPPSSGAISLPLMGNPGQSPPDRSRSMHCMTLAPLSGWTSAEPSAGCSSESASTQAHKPRARLRPAPPIRRAHQRLVEFRTH